MASPLKLVASTSRLISLDLLRLLAIVMVLCHHMEPSPNDLTWSLKPVLDSWCKHGCLGVDLFFVLSGFLVSGLLFSEYRNHGNISVSRFYVRRAWKIYPPFYFLIGCTFFYCLFVLNYKLRDRPLFSELLFLQSYQTGIWNHTWTLAVEEHFYLALPLVLLLLVRRNRGAEDPFRPVLYLVAATSAVCLAARFINYGLRAEVTNLTHSFSTHLRVDALFFGVVIAYAYHFHADWFRRSFQPRRYALILAGIGLLASLDVIVPSAEWYRYTVGFTQSYLGAAAILVGMLMCQIPSNRITLALATLGTYSYSIYLWHMALMYYAIPHLRTAGVSWLIRSAVFVCGAFIIGFTMAKLLELPTIRLRDRWFPSRSGDETYVSPELPMPQHPVSSAA